MKKQSHKAIIHQMSHDGRGIAKINGKVTFIQNALTNEMVTFEYLRQKKDYDEGIAISIDNPSSVRTSPPCPHFTLCGGCTFQHLVNEEQINLKQSLLLDMLARIGHVKPTLILPPLSSESLYYRHKARLSVRFVEKKNRILVGFREKNQPRFIADIDSCYVLHYKVAKALPSLRSLIQSFDNPRAISQIEVAVGDETVGLIFRNLESLSKEDLDKLSAFHQETAFNIYLQPSGIDSVYLCFPEKSSMYLSYHIESFSIRIEFLPTDFTQINLKMNQLMVQQAIKLLDLKETSSVLDLYCGLGNFSLPMATLCEKVVGIEGHASMVVRARRNATLNQLSNTEFYTENLEVFEKIEWLREQYFTHVLLDPPRVGALNMVKQLCELKIPNIVYISCNPATLARDAAILVKEGYIMKEVGVIDMFPHTAHIESIAHFIWSK